MYKADYCLKYLKLFYIYLVSFCGCLDVTARRKNALQEKQHRPKLKCFKI